MSQQEYEGFSYAETGVDVNIEAKAAKIMYEAAKTTWLNRQEDLGEIIVPFDDFSGLRFVRVGRLPAGTVMSSGTDGVATKTDLARRAGQYNTVGHDLIAMVCDDAVIRGGEPIVLTNDLEVNTLGKDEDRLPFIRQIADGLVAAAECGNVAVINGEIAQLNDTMGNLEKFLFNWSASVTWVAHESRLLTGHKVKPGDIVVGLPEPGFRSNGISLLRRILQKKYGDEWEKATLNGQSIVDLSLLPSTIYTRAVVDMIGGWNLTREPRAALHAAAHITGGGPKEKLGRALRPSGFGAVINDPFSPSPLMLHCQDLANVPDEEAYGTWCMGIGMALITPSPDAVIQVARDHGLEAKVIGEVTKQPGLVIHSKGREGKVLEF